jgi:hypothetical protein
MAVDAYLLQTPAVTDRRHTSLWFRHHSDLSPSGRGDSSPFCVTLTPSLISPAVA